jgi:hypothetical protein
VDGVDEVSTAAAVAAGELDVVRTPDVLEIAQASRRTPIPVAVYPDGDWCTVLLVTSLPLGYWTTEVVPVYRGEVNGMGGATGGVAHRSNVESGKPFAEGEFRTGAGEGNCLVAVDGVSADNAVRMRWGEQIVAEAEVASHGYFVLAAVLPNDAQVTVEAV